MDSRADFVHGAEGGHAAPNYLDLEQKHETYPINGYIFHFINHSNRPSLATEGRISCDCKATESTLSG